MLSWPLLFLRFAPVQHLALGLRQSLNSMTLTCHLIPVCQYFLYFLRQYKRQYKRQNSIASARRKTSESKKRARERRGVRLGRGLLSAVRLYVVKVCWGQKA